MLRDVVSWVAVGGILMAAAGLVLSRDWRWSLAFLALQYLAAFWLVGLHWPIGLASAKLVTGWMAAAILGMTRLGLAFKSPAAELFWPQRRWFHLFLVAAVATLAAAATPRLETILPGLGTAVVGGSTLLMTMGLLHLGLTADVLRVTLGLLTVLSGFEVVYSAVEGSILVAAMLAIVNLGLALTGSYLMLAEPEGTEA
jgi:hypothetical protein